MISQVLKKQFNAQWIKLNMLNIGQPYQRPIKAHKVSDIVANFNAYQLAPMIVSKREDDTFWVLDGQHRVRALRQMEWTNQEVLCQVLTGLSYEDEAELHGLYQVKRSTHTPIELYVTFLEAKRPLEVGIQTILDRYDLGVGRNRNESTVGVIGSVEALRTIYLQDPELLDRVLNVVVEAWGKETDGYHGNILRGLALVMQHYPKTLNDKWLINSLQHTRPTVILAKAKEQQRVSNAPAVNNVGVVIVVSYNSMKGGKKLPGATDLLRPGSKTFLSTRSTSQRPGLTIEQTTEIRKLYVSDASMTNKQLAEKFGVGVSQVYKVTRGLAKAKVK